MQKQKQVSVVCTDADRPVLAEMAKPDAPRAACLGLDPKLNGEYAAELIVAALKYKTVAEAKANMNTLYVVPTDLMSNTDPKKEFKTKRVFTLNEAWQYYHSAHKRPW